MCLTPAAVLARSTFPGKALLEGLLLAPALVPSMTFAMGLHYLFIRISLADTMTGVVLVLAVSSYPYMLRALTAGFQAMGTDLGACARNLGAGPLETLVRVEFPLLLPAVAAGGGVVFLVGGGRVASFTGTLFPLLFSSNRSLAAGLTLVFLVIPILLFAAMDAALVRFFRKRGMTR
jgi:putative spermidine/putrescine transport system permease protein